MAAVLRGISSPQNENFLIHSLTHSECHPRCSCLSFFGGKDKLFSGFFSTQLQLLRIEVQINAVLKGFDVLQTALYDPS